MSVNAKKDLLGKSKQQAGVGSEDRTFTVAKSCIKGVITNESFVVHQIVEVFITADE